jgi:hypothetical protein
MRWVAPDNAFGAVKALVDRVIAIERHIGILDRTARRTGDPIAQQIRQDRRFAQGIIGPARAGLEPGHQ